MIHLFSALSIPLYLYLGHEAFFVYLFWIFHVQACAACITANLPRDFYKDDRLILSHIVGGTFELLGSVSVLYAVAPSTLNQWQQLLLLAFVFSLLELQQHRLRDFIVSAIMKIFVFLKIGPKKRNIKKIIEKEKEDITKKE